MTYTPHGHHINGTTKTDENYGVTRARCGGPGRCRVCNHFVNKVYTEGKMLINQYARKVLEVKAVKVTQEDLSAIAFWCNGAVIFPDDSYLSGIVITDADGFSKSAEVGQYIVKQPTGGYKVADAEDFEADFEKV